MKFNLCTSFSDSNDIKRLIVFGVNINSTFLFQNNMSI